ncbi:MAG: hypothetical protein OQK12_18080, partial [Motiliproteus sp.]|nr:hypothetical protein [Motiliproteus sp.]
MGFVATAWGISGICLILGSAIYRLSIVGMEAFTHSLDWYHWLVGLIWLVFMAFSEGYRGFQQGFSPRVAARIAYLYQNPTPVRLILAPLFCMGYFHIERKRQIITFVITLMIIAIVQVVHQLEQPWRGIIDIGVVVGLAWGLISLLIFTFQAFT